MEILPRIWLIAWVGEETITMPMELSSAGIGTETMNLLSLYRPWIRPVSLWGPWVRTRSR